MHHFSNNKHLIEQKLQTGFSQRYWLHTELENGIADSISNDTKGMYFELDNKYIKKAVSYTHLTLPTIAKV